MSCILIIVREGGSSLGVVLPCVGVRLVNDDVGEEPGSTKFGVDLLRLWLSKSAESGLRCAFTGKRLLPSFGVPPELLVLIKRETRSRPGVPSIVELWLWLSDFDPCDSEVATADTFVTWGAAL